MFFRMKLFIDQPTVRPPRSGERTTPRLARNRDDFSGTPNSLTSRTPVPNSFPTHSLKGKRFISLRFFREMADPITQDEYAKRRKVRKGTQSCWECKRRKVRCIFASDANTICDNCKRRGTACISQELPYQPAALANSNPQIIEARLGRVEELVEQLVSNTIQSSTEALHETRSISAVLEDREKSRPKVISPTRRITAVRISHYQDFVSQ